MLDLTELLRDVPSETQSRLYEKMATLDEAAQARFAEQVAQAVNNAPQRGGAGAPLSEERARREARAPQPGSPAPDFELSRLEGEGRVRLSGQRGRPVGLIFGSYT